MRQPRGLRIGSPISRLNPVTGVFQFDPFLRAPALALEPGRQGVVLQGDAAGRLSTLTAISIQFSAGGRIHFRDSHKLFSFVALTSFSQINALGYSPTPDGKRFLVGVRAEGEKPELNIVLNWQKLIPTQAK